VTGKAGGWKAALNALALADGIRGSGHDRAPSSATAVVLADADSAERRIPRRICTTLRCACWRPAP